MLTYLPTWRRALLLIGTIGAFVVAGLSIWHGAPVVIKPWQYAVEMLLFMLLALAQADCENRNRRTAIRGAGCLQAANRRHDEATDPLTRAYYRGAGNAFGNFLVLDGQIPESDLVIRHAPDVLPAKEPSDA